MIVKQIDKLIRDEMQYKLLEVPYKIPQYLPVEVTDLYYIKKHTYSWIEDNVKKKKKFTKFVASIPKQRNATSFDPQSPPCKFPRKHSAVIKQRNK